MTLIVRASHRKPIPRCNYTQGPMGAKTEPATQGRLRAYLRSIGVEELPPATSPFDPGYDPVTLESHLRQSAHLMSSLKISMACWQIADESASREKFAAARRYGVPPSTGGGPFEVAVAQKHLDQYLDLAADMGAELIECGSGFTEMSLSPKTVLDKATQRGLRVQYELGEKHGGSFGDDTVAALIERGQSWLDAGAVQLVIEARESAQEVGLFDDQGDLNQRLADRFADTFGLGQVMFEAPNKASQFALLDHFGNRVRLCNVRLEEILRVEIYRRGLHSDAFRRENLRPRFPA